MDQKTGGVVKDDPMWAYYEAEVDSGGNTHTRFVLCPRSQATIGVGDRVLVGGSIERITRVTYTPCERFFSAGKLDGFSRNEIGGFE